MPGEIRIDLTPFADPAIWRQAQQQLAAQMTQQAAVQGRLAGSTFAREFRTAALSQGFAGISAGGRNLFRDPESGRFLSQQQFLGLPGGGGPERLFIAGPPPPGPADHLEQYRVSSFGAPVYRLPGASGFLNQQEALAYSRTFGYAVASGNRFDPGQPPLVHSAPTVRPLPPTTFQDPYQRALPRGPTPLALPPGSPSVVGNATSGLYEQAYGPGFAYPYGIGGPGGFRGRPSPDVDTPIRDRFGGPLALGPGPVRGYDEFGEPIPDRLGDRIRRDRTRDRLLRGVPGRGARGRLRSAFGNFFGGDLDQFGVSRGQQRLGDFLLGTATFLPGGLRNVALGAGFTSRFGGSLGLAGLGISAGLASGAGVGYISGRRFIEGYTTAGGETIGADPQGQQAIQDLINSVTSIGDILTEAFGPAIVTAIQALAGFAGGLDNFFRTATGQPNADEATVSGVLGQTARFFGDAIGFVTAPFTYGDLERHVGEQALIQAQQQRLADRRRQRVPSLQGFLPSAGATTFAAISGYGQITDRTTATLNAREAAEAAQRERLLNEGVATAAGYTGIPAPLGLDNEATQEVNRFFANLRRQARSLATIQGLDRADRTLSASGGYGGLEAGFGFEAQQELSRFYSGLRRQASQSFLTSFDDITQRRIQLGQELNRLLAQETQLRYSLIQHQAREALDLPRERVELNRTLGGFREFQGVTPRQGGTPQQEDLLLLITRLGQNLSGLEDQSLDILSRRAGGDQNIPRFIQDFLRENYQFNLGDDQLGLLGQQVSSARASEASEDLSLQRQQIETRQENTRILELLNSNMESLNELFASIRQVQSPLYNSSIAQITLPGGP